MTETGLVIHATGMVCIRKRRNKLRHWPHVRFLAFPQQPISESFDVIPRMSIRRTIDQAKGIVSGGSGQPRPIIVGSWNLRGARHAAR